MKYLMWAITGSLAFWALLDLRETNPVALFVILCIYVLYAFILYVRDYSGGDWK
jgi:hypothetical protein